ncbi:hypothetical protein EP7_003416 [Isosphaeraceae bacterium EP7]
MPDHRRGFAKGSQRPERHSSRVKLELERLEGRVVPAIILPLAQAGGLIGPSLLGQASGINAEAATLTLTPTTLPPAQVLASYSQTIVATGATGDVFFSVASGELPAGLQLSPFGNLIGRPLFAGDVNFVISAVDSVGATGSIPYTLTIQPQVLPSVTLSVSGSPTQVLPGQNLTYTITVTNNGPSDAFGVAIANTLPVGVAYVSAITTQGTVSVSSSMVSADIGLMPANTSQTLTIVALPLASAAGQTVVNWIEVSVGGGDSDPNNNSAAISTQVLPVPPPTVSNLARYGYHYYPTRLVVSFDRPMDASTAGATSNYQLINLGPDRKLGTHDDRVVPIVAATYSAANSSVTLAPRTRLALHNRLYQLVVLDSVKSADGVALDGVGDGLPGSNYVRTFGQNILQGKVPPQETTAKKVAAKATAKPKVAATGYPGGAARHALLLRARPISKG